MSYDCWNLPDNIQHINSSFSNDAFSCMQDIGNTLGSSITSSLSNSSLSGMSAFNTSPVSPQSIRSFSPSSNYSLSSLNSNVHSPNKNPLQPNSNVLLPNSVLTPKSNVSTTWTNSHTQVTLPPLVKLNSSTPLTPPNSANTTLNNGSPNHGNLINVNSKNYTVVQTIPTQPQYGIIYPKPTLPAQNKVPTILKKEGKSVVPTTQILQTTSPHISANPSKIAPNNIISLQKVGQFQVPANQVKKVSFHAFALAWPYHVGYHFAWVSNH